MKLPIFMDNHATTPVDPRVLEAMLPYFREDFGNAASRNHAFGWKAEAAVEKARDAGRRRSSARRTRRSSSPPARPSPTTSRSRASPSSTRRKGDHIITVKTEHKADPRHLQAPRAHAPGAPRRAEAAAADRSSPAATVQPEDAGRSSRPSTTLDKDAGAPALEHELLHRRRAVTYLDVEKDGRVEPGEARRGDHRPTILVSIMLANNEIGTVQPIDEIGKLCRERGVLFHTDAVQGVGKVPFDVEEMKVDLASISAHKMYGPKGVGALYVRRKPRVRIAPIIDGGGHERGMRSGTLNVAGIVGFGKAARARPRPRWPTRPARISRAARAAAHGPHGRAGHVHVNGSLEHRLPGNLNISFAYVEGEALMMAIKDVAVSLGLGLHLGLARAVATCCARCGVDEEMAHTLDPLRPRPLQHRGRGRLRGRPGGGQGEASCAR